MADQSFAQRLVLLKFVDARLLLLDALCRHLVPGMRVTDMLPQSFY